MRTSTEEEGEGGERERGTTTKEEGAGRRGEPHPHREVEGNLLECHSAKVNGRATQRRQRGRQHRPNEAEGGGTTPKEK